MAVLQDRFACKLLTKGLVLGMNHSSFTRIFRLDEILRNGAFHSIDQVAEDLEVSKRTIERDLEKMRYELGADIEYNRQYSRYEYTGSTVALPAGWLNDSEIAVILIAERALRMYAQASFSDSIHPAFNKMLNPVRHKSDMMESIREKCRSVYFHRSFEDVRGLRNEFSKILRAIMERKRISIDYPRKGSDDIIKRGVEPYSLVNNNSEWQVIARSVKQRRIKTFSLKKISNIEILDYYFDIPNQYDVRDYVFHPFDDFKNDRKEEIELNVYPPVSKSVKEVIWHSSQVMKKSKKDDRINIRIKCNLTSGLIDWVFGMQEYVEVVKPERLRNMIRKKAEAMAERNGE